MREAPKEGLPYNETKANFEQYWCQITDPHMYVYVRFNEETKERVVAKVQEPKLYQRTRAWSYMKPDKKGIMHKTPFVRDWLRDAAKREYSSIASATHLPEAPSRPKKTRRATPDILKGLSPGHHTQVP